MAESLQCPSCDKVMKKTRLVVVHPKNNKFLFVCSEACARKTLVQFCSKDQSLDYCSLKIYYNRNSYKDLLIFKGFKKRSINKRKTKKKPITDNELLDFKINFGLNSEKIINKLINSGKRIYEKELKNQ